MISDHSDDVSRWSNMELIEGRPLGRSDAALDRGGTTTIVH